VQLDFLDEHQWNQFGKFDMIVSNPPYIPLNEKESMDKQVTEWEPELALFVPGSAALLFYEKIAAFAANHLMEGGKVYVETHTRYAAGVSGLFSNHFKSTEMRTDMSGNDRMVKAVK
jgi:release factor glutamine methyltransferase